MSNVYVIIPLLEQYNLRDVFKQIQEEVIKYEIDKNSKYIKIGVQEYDRIIKNTNGILMYQNNMKCYHWLKYPICEWIFIPEIYSSIIIYHYNLSL
jgi:hypothetical protein